MLLAVQVVGLRGLEAGQAGKRGRWGSWGKGGKRSEKTATIRGTVHLELQEWSTGVFFWGV